MEVPNVSRIEYNLIDVTEEGYLSLWTIAEMFEMTSTATTTQNFWMKSKRSSTPVTK